VIDFSVSSRTGAERAVSQYKVMVDDNFHYMEEDERRELGTFAKEVLAACRTLVDRWLVDNHKPAKERAEALCRGS
jgi:hypothetical protein